jgi:hypothetical protein
VLRKYGLLMLAPLAVAWLAYMFSFTVEDVSNYSPQLHEEFCSGAQTKVAREVCVAAFYGAMADGCVNRETSYLFENGFGGAVFPKNDPRLALYKRSYAGQRQVAGNDQTLCARVYSEALVWQQVTACTRRVPVMISEALQAQHSLVGRPACKMGVGPDGTLAPMVR